jgi:hypothetical protein
VEEGRRSSISEAELRRRRRGARKGGRGARRERRTKEMIITFIIGRGRYLARCRAAFSYTIARMRGLFVEGRQEAGKTRVTRQDNSR